MRTIDDFVTLVRDDVGLLISDVDLDAEFDQLAGWDSVHLLTLAMAVERRTGRPVLLADVLTARSLGQIYRMVSR